MVLIYLECHLCQLLSLNLERVRFEPAEERFGICVQLCPCRDDQRRCIRIFRELFCLIALERVAKHVLENELSSTMVFGKELLIDFSGVLGVIWEVASASFVDCQASGLTTVVEDVVDASVLGMERQLRKLTELKERLVRDGPLIAAFDRVHLKYRVKISVAVRHIETVLVDRETVLVDRETGSLFTRLHLLDQVIEVLRHGELLGSVVLATSFDLGFREFDQKICSFLTRRCESIEHAGKS